jgi:hypothetical protein
MMDSRTFGARLLIEPEAASGGTEASRWCVATVSPLGVTLNPT